MTVETTSNEVKKHFRLPEMEGCYLLLCDGASVTFRSQQVRALNLLHGLYSDPQSGGEKFETNGSRSSAGGGRDYLCGRRRELGREGNALREEPSAPSYAARQLAPAAASRNLHLAE